MPPSFLPVLLLGLLSTALLASAHDHGGHSGSSGGHVHLTAFLHFSPAADTLWVYGWIPTRPGPIFGACVGLFLLGIAERWVSAVRAGVEAGVRREAVWKERVLSAQSLKQKQDPACADTFAPLIPTIFMRPGTTAPFVLEHAYARFVIHIAQQAFAVLFMLTLMSFQVGFILSQAAGAGVGEMLYGRFIDAALAGIQEDEDEEDEQAEAKDK
ncbi:hypothetical protein DXG03_005371 [Asterophora parasitica]|uniref:Copper transport protein n=1 Tax=Asterophora parasitica TaxID=117018 RepID=A0A9P7G607_9AGAR|nr:hypothetical protein DXG03_005371 [Asterophora parasitica]